MDPKEILKFCIENGLLIEPEVLNLFSEAGDAESAKLLLGKLRTHTQKRIITKSMFETNKEQVSEFFLTLPEENQKKLEKLKIKLGLQIEISKEVSSGDAVAKEVELVIPEESVKIISPPIPSGRKLTVSDFVTNFKNKFYEMKTILQERQELENLVSVNKLSRGGQRTSIIGMVSDKRITKNKNILLDVEDLTGAVRVLINQNKPELYEKAEEIALDSIIGFSGFGDREIFFANNLVFPDAVLLERKKSPVDESALFAGDLHYGSKLFLEDNFKKLIDYINGKGSSTNESSKIKYLFLVGDVVAGIGNYPGQEKDLKINDLETQFQGIADLLGEIRKDVKIIISPGNHDCVRLMEPQPKLDEKYAWPIYQLKNVLLTENPAQINLGSTRNFSGFDVLAYHGFSYPYYSDTIPSLVKGGMNAPEKIMKYLLKNRHLAPSHASVQYFPCKKDRHLIKQIPDIFVSGHSHKCAVSYYNNILIVSTGTFEEETDHQKKMGNNPDFCKVPIFNLKSRAIKILDFE